ncbi:hypothetical protein IFM89_030038 [Coptis chinensis]|uniref:Polygalacturonase n=1 Tax=Coptis chinensis TaxID=261450 RepID=A0A835M7J5_9MAGN|nr:hypothetical protein IFM89_030038 [Coptis chinensis]
MVASIDFRIVSVLCLALLSCLVEGTDFNVLDHGAKADGKSDCAKAFLEAWQAACHSPGSARLVIPKGTFVISEAMFTGPCTGFMTVQLIGTIQATTGTQYKEPEWLGFEKLTGFLLTGGGTFDGQGQKVWEHNSSKKAVVSISRNLIIFSSNINFEDIIMKNVKNPIIIDQEYCAAGSCGKASKASKVKISNVKFKNIRGTSTSKVAVNMRCSPEVPCSNVELFDIDLKYVGAVLPGLSALSECSNVKVGCGGILNPPPCLSSTRIS